MTDDEVIAMVTAEQLRRSFQRAVGRTIRANKHKAPPSLKTLEQLGLAPSIIERMRASGVKEQVLIAQIQKAGLL